MQYVRYRYIMISASGKTSLDELDISLMYKLFRNVIMKIPPTDGWDKKPKDTSNNPADDIERIRGYRNDIAHSDDYEMTTKDFNNSVLELIGVAKYQMNNKNHFTLINLLCISLPKRCFSFLVMMLKMYFRPYNDYREMMRDSSYRFVMF